MVTVYYNDGNCLFPSIPTQCWHLFMTASWLTAWLLI